MAKHMTESEVAQARKLYRKLGNYNAVARIMGRGKTTINEQVNGLRGNRVFRATEASIPDSVLVDRDRRYHLAPRNLTAAFFGDPLPGYSAAERR